jgi:hypothetical protein
MLFWLDLNVLMRSSIPDSKDFFFKHQFFKILSRISFIKNMFTAYPGGNPFFLLSPEQWNSVKVKAICRHFMIIRNPHVSFISDLITALIFIVFKWILKIWFFYILLNDYPHFLFLFHKCTHSSHIAN